MKRFSVLFASLAMAGMAQAATLSFSVGLPSNQFTTEIHLSGQLGLFNPALGSLTSAELSYSSAATSTITLLNTAAQDQTARAISTMAMTMGSDLATVDALMPDQTLLFSTGAALTYAPGQSRTFGPLTDATSTTVNLSSVLAALYGVGTFGVSCDSLTSTTVVGGGGNVRASQDTMAGCGAQIVYTYNPSWEPETPNDVPEPGALALAALSLGLVALGRRRFNGQA